MDERGPDPIALITERLGVRCTRLNTIPKDGLFVVDATFENGTRLKATGLTNEGA